MMDDHMFGCYHCHAQMDELQDLVAHSKTEHADVSANFSFRYFVKTKNIYQSIHLKYPVSHIPEDCHIYLQNGKLILRLYVNLSTKELPRFTVTIHTLQNTGNCLPRLPNAQHRSQRVLTPLRSVRKINHYEKYTFIRIFTWPTSILIH